MRLTFQVYQWNQAEISPPLMRDDLDAENGEVNIVPAAKTILSQTRTVFTTPRLCP